MGAPQEILDTTQQILTDFFIILVWYIKSWLSLMYYFEEEWSLKNKSTDIIQHKLSKYRNRLIANKNKQKK